MQIISFPAHYQSVYTNFDISSFSLISCTVKWAILHGKMAEIDGQENGGMDARFVRPILF